MLSVSLRAASVCEGAQFFSDGRPDALDDAGGAS